MGGQGADEFLVPDANLAQLAAGKKRGLAKIVWLDILVLKARPEAAGLDDRGRGGFGLNLAKQPLDFALRKNLAFIVVWIHVAHRFLHAY